MYQASQIDMSDVTTSYTSKYWSETGGYSDDCNVKKSSNGKIFYWYKGGYNEYNFSQGRYFNAQTNVFYFLGYSV